MLYIYMPTLTPSQPPQLIGIYGSPMECLGSSSTSGSVHRSPISPGPWQKLDGRPHLRSILSGELRKWLVARPDTDARSGAALRLVKGGR